MYSVFQTFKWKHKYRKYTLQSKKFKWPNECQKTINLGKETIKVEWESQEKGRYLIKYLL